MNEEVDPANAPVAVTHAEHVVFANLYETLVNITCEGDLVPGLAHGWESHEDGRRWRLSLRRDALLWDGTQVTAHLVIESWQRNATLAAAKGQPFPGSWLAAIGQGLTPVDKHTLEIVLDQPWRNLPGLLAHRDLAVAAQHPGWLWPLGSGPCRLSAGAELPLPNLVCRPNLHHPDRPAWISLTFRVLPGCDARDLLDDTTHLAVFRERRTADYFAQLADVQVAPLLWDHLYVLLIPPGSSLDASRLAGIFYEQTTLAESLPWTSLFLRDCQPDPCRLLQDSPADVLTQPWILDPALAKQMRQQILFQATDNDARSLANRMAAFLPPGFSLVAAKQQDLSESLHLGRAAGYITRHGASHPDACLTLSALLARANWLRQGIEPSFEPDIKPSFDPCALANRLQHDGLVLPLVATRAHLAWRGPLAGLELAHDGAPLVARLGLATPPQELP